MAYQIGNISVNRPLQPAPMAGISDSPFRRVCRRHGSPISIAEFVPARAVINDEEWARPTLSFHNEERPFIFQIFGDSPDEMGHATEILARYEPDAIELNSGCSVKKVAMTGAGAGLLQTPEKAARIIERMSGSTNHPITAKIRIGWDTDNLNYIEYTQRLIDAGAQAITVHGRTRCQGYKGEADWDIIGEIKSRFRSTPIIGNGDVCSRSNGLERLRKYNLEGVAIGRAAQGNPWIFSDLGRPDGPVNVVQTMEEHFKLMIDHYPADRVAVLFRKHAASYFKTLRMFGDFTDVRPGFMQATDIESVSRAFQFLIKTVEDAHFKMGSHYEQALAQ